MRHLRAWALSSDRRTWVAVFLSTWVVYLLTAHWRSGQVSDTKAAIWPAWVFVHHGTFYLDHVRNLPHNEWFQHYGTHLVSNRTMGVVLAGVPVCAALSWTGLSPEHLNALNGSLLGALAIAFLYLVFRTLVTQRVALAATAVLAFGTSMWTVAGAETWPQSVDALCAALALLAVARARYWLAGLALAPAIMTRPHMALAAAVLGVWLTVARRSLRPGIGIGVPSAAGLGLLLWWNSWMFGGASVAGGYGSYAGHVTGAPGDHGPVAYLENAAGAFFTPGVGLFVFTPVALVATYAIVRHCRDKDIPAWVRAACAGGVAYELMQLRLNLYTGGGGFYGNRLLIELGVLSSPLAVVACARWTAWHPWRRFTLAFLAGWSVATRAVGALLAYYLVGSSLAGDPWTSYYPADVVRAAGVNGLLVVIPAVACLAVFTVHAYRAATHDPGDRSGSPSAKITLAEREMRDAGPVVPESRSSS